MTAALFGFGFYLIWYCLSRYFFSLILLVGMVQVEWNSYNEMRKTAPLAAAALSFSFIPVLGEIIFILVWLVAT